MLLAQIHHRLRGVGGHRRSLWWISILSAQIRHKFATWPGVTTGCTGT